MGYYSRILQVLLGISDVHFPHRALMPSFAAITLKVNQRNKRLLTTTDMNLCCAYFRQVLTRLIQIKGISVKLDFG